MANFVKLLLLMVCYKLGSSSTITRINRHFNGDIFVDQGCKYNLCDGVTNSVPLRGGGGCQCQCPAERSTFREDIGQCVNNIQSCILSDFVSGNSSEKIPFVFLPLPGQLIYPSAEISIPSSGSSSSPVCVVSTLNIMTESGWSDLQNITEQFQQPFQLFREGDRTLLQWMGGDNLLQILEGRLILINLLCKDLGRKENTLYSPCISFRVAGSPGKIKKAESERGGDRLTEREYLAIGICSGFLLMLYIFAMIVFLLIRRRHQRDKRLREQFMNLPLPQGLGYKSSRILGLDESYNPYFGNGAPPNKMRLSTRSTGHCSIHSKTGVDQDQIYDITKKSGSGSGSGSESDASVVLEMNEKLLEAHKKVVQSKLNREVARTIYDGTETIGSRTEDNCSEISSPRMNNSINLIKHAGSHNRRFAPHLEGIPEESRANTLTGKSNDSHSDRRTNDGSTVEGEERVSEINESRKTSKEQSQMKKLSTSDPQSLDSGILTRSSSISDLSDSHTDAVTSNDFDSDNETVDVADSDDTDTDSDTYVGGSVRTSSSTIPTRYSETRRFDNRKKDFVSEIYNTAVSKVPKVIPSDTESLYSSNSTIRREFEYDSLDINSNCRLRDIYTNPSVVMSERRRTDKLEKDDYELVNVKSAAEGRENVAEVYVNKEYDPSAPESGTDDSDPGYEYSAGEKMLISISGDNESVYSNKLLISVNSNQVPSKFFSDDLNFDPDTLERASNNGKMIAQSLESLDSTKLNNKSRSSNNSKAKSSFYLFRDDVKEITGTRLDASLPPFTSPTPRKPSLPPKTRMTPKLPPKPTTSSSRVSQRPLPPPPPPPMK